MIDIHCHILPGVDDGPSTIDDSLEMASIAAGDGIRTIVATPHARDDLYDIPQVTNRLQELKARIEESRLPLDVLLGADVNAFIDPGLLAGYTINGTRYILVEFPNSHLPINFRDALFKMVVSRFIPIVTHPERNASFVHEPSIASGLVDSGALIQITANSLAGYFGPDVRDCAKELLGLGVVHFIATDAHSSSERSPILSEGLSVAESILGREAALRLVTSNPESVIRGQRLEA